MWILVTYCFYLNFRGCHICLTLYSRYLNLRRYSRNYKFPHLNKERMEKGKNKSYLQFFFSYRFDTRQQEMFHMVNFSPFVTFFDRVMLFYQWIVILLQRFSLLSFYILIYLTGAKISLYLNLWCTNWSSHKFSTCWTGPNLGLKTWHQTYANIFFLHRAAFVSTVIYFA